jgi:hypothetical protein
MEMQQIIEMVAEMEGMMDAEMKATAGKYGKK